MLKVVGSLTPEPLSPATTPHCHPRERRKLRRREGFPQKIKPAPPPPQGLALNQEACGRRCAPSSRGTCDQAMNGRKLSTERSSSLTKSTQRQGPRWNPS